MVSEMALLRAATERLADLKPLFAEVAGPVLESDLEQLEGGGWAGGVTVQVPEPLKALWRVGAEWHLIRDHYRVFGFNIMSPVDAQKACYSVFGDGGHDDRGMREEWAAEVRSQGGGVSAADKGWLPLCAVSEYDYYVVCLDAESACWGAVRHITNNTTEDRELVPAPFDNFVERLTPDGLLRRAIKEAKEREEEEMEGEA